MGLPMAKNVVQKCGLPVLGYDVVQQQMDAFREAGGIPVSDPAEIYKACDVILQILPTHPIIRNSVEQAIQYGKPGNVIVDLSSTAPDIILELYQQAKDAGMFLLDSPVSGGNPMAIAGTLAIMTGGDKEAFVKVKPVLACMGSPVYTGGPASGSVTKLVNNMIGGAILVAIAEGYAFAAKAGIDLQTTFEATRGGFAGGPMYDNQVPKIIKRDYTPGARIAVHRKDILGSAEVVGLNAEREILGLNEAVVAAGKLILQHTGVLGADAVKLVPAGRNGNAPCKGFLRSREVHKGKLELHGAVKVVQEITPRLKDGGLVLVLRKLVVDVLILDRFGVARIGHTADAVRPHTLIRDAVLRRFFFFIRSVRSCDGGFDLFSFGAGQLFLFGQFDTPPGLTGFAAPERHKNCWSYTGAALASGSTRGRCCG